MKYSLALLGLFCALMLFSAGTHLQHGIVGLTQMNGEGCLCHNFNRDETVRLTLSGPDSLYAGSNAVYTLKVTGGPKVTGGLNIAVRKGALAPVDTTTQIIDNELTHTRPKPFVNDTLTFKFRYSAPLTTGNDTLFSVSLSTNGDLIPTELDKWNFGIPFRVRILPVVPVELSAFSASGVQAGVALHWSTISEVNNAGFKVYQRTAENAAWKEVAFVKGNGTTQQKQDYSIVINTRESTQYRLEQYDFNGSYRSVAQSGFIAPQIPAGFNVVQNYPNPFNNSTIVRITLPDAGFVTLDVYSLNGEKVKSVIPGSKGAGEYREMLNLEGLSAGTYFYRVTLNTGARVFTDTKKLVYLK